MQTFSRKSERADGQMKSITWVFVPFRNNNNNKKSVGIERSAHVDRVHIYALFSSWPSHFGSITFCPRCLRICFVLRVLVTNYLWLASIGHNFLSIFVDSLRLPCQILSLLSFMFAIIFLMARTVLFFFFSFSVHQSANANHVFSADSFFHTRCALFTDGIARHTIFFRSTSWNSPDGPISRDICRLLNAKAFSRWELTNVERLPEWKTKHPKRCASNKPSRSFCTRIKLWINEKYCTENDTHT